MDSIDVKFENTCDLNIKIVENFFQFLKRADWRFPVVDGAYRILLWLISLDLLDKAIGLRSKVIIILTIVSISKNKSQVISLKSYRHLESFSRTKEFSNMRVRPSNWERPP